MIIVLLALTLLAYYIAHLCKILPSLWRQEGAEVSKGNRALQVNKEHAILRMGSLM